MHKKNQNGFTLVLSLVLLLVMSLMGGSLVVIASGDHQNNNTSDQYQQTFYVAEHALLEAEKHLINRILGPWVSQDDLVKCEGGGDCNISNYELEIPDDVAEAMSEEAKTLMESQHSNYTAQLLVQANASQNNDGATPVSGAARNIDMRDIPSNLVTPTQTPCFKSFKNLLRKTTDNDGNEIDQLVTNHSINQNFGDVISPILSKGDTGLSSEEADDELEYLNRFRFEFFAINSGPKTFKGSGMSLKKSSTNVQRQGTAYKIYGCGYLMPKNEAGFNNPDILIPLETVIVLST